MIAFHLGTALNAAVDRKCLDWFAKAKIERGERCEWKCTAAPVDMGTFYCGSHCPELCRIAFDAHEADEDIASSARAMDLANNRAGLLAAETLRKKNNLNQTWLLGLIPLCFTFLSLWAYENLSPFERNQEWMDGFKES